MLEEIALNVVPETDPPLVEDFGEKCLTEVTDCLDEMNLAPGMNLDRVREHLPVVP